jgi:hypothetical protein
MTAPVAEPPPSPGARFFGWLLLMLGALMVVLCGGCTLTLWVVTILGASQTHGAPGSAAALVASGVAVVAVIGGVPAACGGLLVWAGWRILRPRKPRQPAVGTTFD